MNNMQSRNRGHRCDGLVSVSIGTDEQCRAGRAGLSELRGVSLAGAKSEHDGSESCGAVEPPSRRAASFERYFAGSEVTPELFGRTIRWMNGSRTHSTSFRAIQ